MFLALFSSLAFLLSALLTFLLIKSAKHHSCLHDHHSGQQKFHQQLTPRVGGVAIYSSFWLLAFLSSNDKTLISLLFIASLPVFLLGLLEDITKKISTRWRFFGSLFSALLFYLFTKTVLARLDVPGLETLWELFQAYLPWLVAAVTVVMITGVSQAFNVIDGYNGLMSGYALIVALALGSLSLWLNDIFLANLYFILAASLLGFLAFNYPLGKIFCGDGGAYFIGFLLAVLTLLLVARQESVSPWLPLTLLAYPVVDTVFSLLRRKFWMNKAMDQPDALHLHSVVFRRISKRFFSKRSLLWQNSAVAPFFWGQALILTLLALPFYSASLYLLFLFIAYTIFYLLCYWLLLKRPRNRKLFYKPSS